MPRQLPSLNALRAFEAAARHLSFARAAEELHVTPAAISQQIRLLEDQLGVTLFRRGKKLAMSSPAETILPELSATFDQMERAILKLRPDKSGGSLVISAPPTFAARWLIPRLEDFHVLHPDIHIRLHATRRLVNFQLEDVDIAIRFGAGNYPGLTSERLMHEVIVPVAAPALAARIKNVDDLTRCTLLEDEWHTGNGVFPDWPTWLATSGVDGKPSLRTQHFGDASLAIQAAVSGLGVALSWYSLVMDDIREGRLVRLLDHTIPSTLGYYLVMPQNRSPASKVGAFRSWMIEQASLQEQSPA